ncbi:MAG TPA: hypothetical protein VGF55_09845 [Gemmataceae bacterium]|jgi:hypothetical protein
MTDIAPDVTARFTPEAAARFAEYLAQTRATLEGHAELSPDDVEQDVRAHVAAEFPPGSGWVRLDQLEAVLARLGRPEQWVSDGEGRPSWRRGVDWVRARPGAVRQAVMGAAARLRNGPDDWRLAYLTFGLLVVGIIIFPLLVVLLPASYLLARAAVALSRERGTPLGPQRWLVYPPLVIVSLPLLVGLLFWPIAPGCGMAHEVWRRSRADLVEWSGLPWDFCEFLVYSYFVVGVMSLWLALVGVTFWLFPRLPAAVFTPLYATARRPGRVLALVGGAVFALWLAFSLRTMPVGQWAHEWRQAVDDDRVMARSRDFGQPAAELDPRVDRAAVEPRVRRLVTDFLRACRNRDLNTAVAVTDVPFYTGAAAGTMLLPDAEPVIRDRERLWTFLDGQFRQVRRTEQMPAEVIRVVPNDGVKALDADPAVAATLEQAIAPTFVVGVGRGGRETGRVFVRVRGGQVAVVGMAK